MVKTVFTSKPSSNYDDLIEVRYHFPRTYLNQVERAVGDWIVYYEPRRISSDLGSLGGRQAYFGTARVTKIEADRSRNDHFFAFVSDYLPFDRVVPFKEKGGYYESKLEKGDGSTNKGLFGRAVRSIEEVEYDSILKAGFGITLVGEDSFYKNKQQQFENPDTFGFHDAEQRLFERQIVESVVKRPFRDVAFRHAIRNAYDDTCAMTGLHIINGGGRPEVQAAHIKSVALNGPDSINNGIALSGTIHWMFDRGLVSIDDDYSILTANDKLPQQVKALIRSEGKIKLPSRLDIRPHPRYLAHHRENVFKG
ncbi:MAG: restriction endonuclease [Alphaproteobacteria bacterium]|nr:MAG: restriction endonuclease [Alphaproteobacteria bacterium]